MAPSDEHSGPGEQGQAGRLSRRSLLGAAGVAGSAAIVAAGTVPASAETAGPLTQKERNIILRVARTGAVFPVPFPNFGEPGPATTRATAARLKAADRRLTAPRRALVRAGARDLLESGLLDASQPGLLDGIARRAAIAKRREQQSLVAVVALAVATVSRHFDPNSDGAARVWVGGLRRLHQRGRQPRPIPKREPR